MEPFPFIFIKNVEGVLGILRNRLPQSCNVYNMANALKNSTCPSGSDGPTFYILKPTEATEEKDFWIVGTYYRDDYGMRYAISAPQHPEITDYIKDAFGTSKLFNWYERHDFPCLDRQVSPMIWEISVGVKGNSVRTMPTKIYVMSPQEAAKLEIRHLPSDEIEVKRLDLKFGTDFFVKTWKYKMKNSDLAIRKLLKRNLSAGVYVNGEVVCGTNVNGVGLIGMLHTTEEYRQKGFGSLATRFLIKSQAEIGAFPCSAVEVNNLPSNSFQEKNGFHFSHFADFINHTPS